LGSATRAIGGCRKRTCSTSPLLRRSISIGLWRGSTNNPGPQPVPHALRPSLLTTLLVWARQPPELLVFPPQRNPSRPECIRSILYYINNFCSKYTRTAYRSISERHVIP